MAICCIGAAKSASAQDWKSYNFYQPYPGYVITLTGDTLRGYVVHGDRVQNQQKAIFYADVNDKKTKKEYKPADLKGYRVGDKEYRTIQYSGGLLKKPLNFILVKDDARILTLLHYTKEELGFIQVRKSGETDQEYDERICTEEVLFKKGDEELIKLTSFLMNFKKNMEKLVSDHTELYAKVQRGDKGYGKLNVLDIIKEYNQTYKGN